MEEVCSTHQSLASRLTSTHSPLLPEQGPSSPAPSPPWPPNLVCKPCFLRFCIQVSLLALRCWTTVLSHSCPLLCLGSLSWRARDEGWKPRVICKDPREMCSFEGPA